MALIYVVEDDENIAELIRAALQASSYQVRVFEESESFFERVKLECPDLILLDIMLPGKNGLEMIKILKADAATQNIPVIFLTAKSTEIDKVTGLEGGAEDYITKPFGVLELLARIKTVLRRVGYGEKKGGTVEVGDLNINFTSREIVKNGEKIRLTHQEFELLEYLVHNKGIVLGRETILNAVWGYDFVGDTTRTVDMHVRTLRQKLGDNADSPRYIETVRGYGYKFIG